MERYLIIKTRDELLRIKIGQILYFEADRNYTKLFLSNGIQFTFAINIGKIEEMLEKQVSGSTHILMRVGKSHIINKNHILQIHLPKQKLLLLSSDGKPRELIVSKDPLKVLKDSLEKEMNKEENEE
ncbi:MAG: LytTR family DNA-binding domain-containing protein [Massilibacteroides sp.]|nr:LytTR family DNA-binding domain-containing protein [Massilibacteroides sp.]MDD3061353.1 LytTR family DNA-binding domain-containing protein [Massilibacteroides sp.]MDD4114649.1 LytTR family DNA-binding domain-containing protein [Massilibacteroides sp.]MDD4659444.1 LytTR family DNA-binding domain-containing protein [Massilibacteroides sp.]